MVLTVELLLYLLALLIPTLLIPLIPVLDGVERKVRARMQCRVGPPILQTWYDIMKLFRKEVLIPASASWLFTLAPIVAFSMAVTSLFLIPYGLSNPLGFYGDLIALIYFITAVSVVVVLGGLASGNPFSEVGASRELSLLMPLELALGIALAVIAFKEGSLSLSRLAITSTPSASTVLAYIAVLIYAYVKSSRLPFDIAEAEPEIASGPLIEYGGPLLALVIYSNLIKRFTVSSLFIVLSLGPAVNVITLGIASTVVRYLLNAVLVIALSVITYLGLGAIAVVYGRYRVAHAVEATRRIIAVPLTALILALLGM